MFGLSSKDNEIFDLKIKNVMLHARIEELQEQIQDVNKEQVERLAAISEMANSTGNYAEALAAEKMIFMFRYCSLCKPGRVGVISTNV